MLKTTAAFFFFFLNLAVFAQVPTPEEQIQSLLEKAKDLRYRDLSEAFSASTRALEIAESNGLDSLSAQILEEIAINYSYQADYDQAFTYNHRALAIAEKYKDTITLIDANNNLGIDSYYLEDYEKAQKYFSRVLDLSLAIKDSERIGNSYNNLGLVASEFGDISSEEAYYKKALSFFEEINLERGIAMISLNLGSLYLIKGDLKQAEPQLREAVETYEKMENWGGMIDAKSSLVSLLEEKGELDRALLLAEETHRFAVENDFVSGQVHFLELLNELYSTRGNFKKAHQALTELKVLNDSLLNDETAETIAELETKYETQQKEQEIATLQMENQLSQLKIQAQDNQRNLLILAIVFFALLAGFLFWQYRFKQQTNKILAEKNNTISKTLEEREVLLKEIHHRVKNNLQVISSLLNLQSRFIKDKGAVDAVKEGQNRVKSMALIHQKLYQEDNLAGVNAWEYFTSLTSSLLKSYGADVSVDVDTQDIKLDIDTAIPIGLIINEVISNSLKYAFDGKKEGNISVILTENSESLQLSVSDNGKGFDPSSIDQSGSFGMTLIQSLAQKLKATFEIQNESGTNYIFTIKNYKLI